MPNPRAQLHLNLPLELRQELERRYHLTHEDHGYPSFNSWLVAILESVIYEAPTPLKEGVQS